MYDLSLLEDQLALSPELKWLAGQQDQKAMRSAFGTTLLVTYTDAMKASLTLNLGMDLNYFNLEKNLSRSRVWDNICQRAIMLSAC